MNQCIGNKKAFEKFCNDLDILYHYNYVDPDSVKAVFERQSAKQRIYQKLKKYQMGKKNAIREANYKTQSKDIPYSGSRESKNATSEYRIKFHKKEQETSITKMMMILLTKRISIVLLLKVIMVEFLWKNKKLQ